MCPHRKIEFWNCIYVSLFIHSFTYSYFRKNRPAFPHSKCVTQSSHRTLIFELIYLNLELVFDLFIIIFTYSYFFTIIYLFPIKHQHDISVLKSFNNRPAFIYFHSKCLTARLSFELYLCLFIYSFIHLFVFFFTIIYLFHLI